MASWRYRAAIPARELGAGLNDFGADVLVVAKPNQAIVAEAALARQRGAAIVADFCDDHFARFSFYDEVARLAHEVTAPTAELARRIGATIIADPFEFPEAAPHCNGRRVLWFGHAVNYASLERVLPTLSAETDLRVVSNVPGTIPWSTETMYAEFALADIVILPASAAYKSANRAVEAIRQGCFVVAEPHPSLHDLSVWVGELCAGIDWAATHPREANAMTAAAQAQVRATYAPDVVARKWMSVCERALERARRG
jgi:hypothetical protein